MKEQFSGQRVVVTGAAGFIASHTCEALLARGAEVWGLDSFDPFYPIAYKQHNLARLTHDPRFHFIEGDLTDRPTLQVLFAEAQPTQVVHLAARAGVRPSIERPEEYILTNILGTQRVAAAMLAVGCRALVFASSSSVYGNAAQVPFAETDPCLEPISPYAYTKRACELLLFNQHHLNGLSSICLRFFTVFGPRQRPDLAIHKFVRSIRAQQPIPVFGDGTTSRDYTFVADTVDGILRAAQWQHLHPAAFEIVNLGNHHPVGLLEMIRTIEEACGQPAVLNRLPAQPGDVERTFADITKAQHLFGYHPATPFAHGVQAFVQWFDALPPELRQ
jgi:UDP-glucuronate 4-epimerase